MSADLSHDMLFLDARNVEFLWTAYEPTDDNKVIDFDFTEGDTRTQASLSYNFETNAWNGMIFVAEGAEDHFSDGAEATKLQLSILINALPQQQKSDLESLKTRFAEPGSFNADASAFRL